MTQDTDLLLPVTPESYQGHQLQGFVFGDDCKKYPFLKAVSLVGANKFQSCRGSLWACLGVPQMAHPVPKVLQVPGTARSRRCSRGHCPFLIPKDLGALPLLGNAKSPAFPCGTQSGCVPPAQLRQLEMQLEQEHEQKQMVLHEKQDLEGLIGTLCEQVRGQCPPRGCSVGHALP